MFLTFVKLFFLTIRRVKNSTINIPGEEKNEHIPAEIVYLCNIA